MQPMLKTNKSANKKIYTQLVAKGIDVKLNKTGSIVFSTRSN